MEKDISESEKSFFHMTEKRLKSLKHFDLWRGALGVRRATALWLPLFSLLPYSCFLKTVSTL